MEREIKFRAWLTGWSKYIYSDDYKNLSGFFRACEQHKRYGYEYSIEQYTGVEDKEGKEIYQSDIVEVETEVQKPNFSENALFEEPEYKNAYITAKVIYRDEIGAFDLETIESDPYLKYWGFYGAECPNEIKIIGNIHQHKELIKYK